jgi:hypothetical protein
MPVTRTDRVGDVLDRFPGLLETFLKHGFTPLANPLLRRTLAPSITIERACRMLGVDTGKFLIALNVARDTHTKRIALPVLTGDDHSASQAPAQIPVFYSQSRYPDVAVRKERNVCTQPMP